MSNTHALSEEDDEEDVQSSSNIKNNNNSTGISDGNNFSTSTINRPGVKRQRNEDKIVALPPKKRKFRAGVVQDGPKSEKCSAEEDISNNGDQEMPEVAVFSEISETKNNDLFKKNSSMESFKSAAPVMENVKIGKMMKKMGFQADKGLGAKQQGRTAPVETELRLGRAGLGAKKSAFEPDFQATWDDSQEKIEVKENVEWMPECHLLPCDKSECPMQDWIRVGQKVDVINNETEFCSPVVLQKMLDAKSVFDELDDRDLRNARTRANPFESIKGAFFQNRAAMKTANLDAVFNFELTNPKHLDNESKELVLSVPENHPNNLFYFADVCAGPGGFTEYVLWKRREYSAHGFGFTLRGKDDFKLDHFLASSPEYFEPFYGINGRDGTGDVTNPTNLHNFQELVMKVTNGTGVHLFMADGGFSVEGEENIQEILSKRLYLCQILCAFNILAKGGNLICKLFDVFTPFSAGLLYLMWRCFDKVCLHKPHTSRPANSERYVVAMGFRDDCQDVREHLNNANLKYDEISIDKKLDVLDLVPLEILRESPAFCDYLTHSNEKMAHRQTTYLNKYKIYAKNKMLEDSRQCDIRAQCLEYWKIPDDKRPEPPHPSPTNRFEYLCEGVTEWLGHNGLTVDDNTIDKTNYAEYRCAVVSTVQPTIILALGKHFVFHWDRSNRWDLVDHTVALNLPKNTILLGELTFEYSEIHSKNVQKRPMLRIFDAFMLNGKKIDNLSMRDRLNQVNKFCRACSREFSRSDIGVVRPAEVFKLDALGQVQATINRCVVNRTEKILCKNFENCNYVEFKKLLFYKITKDPWKICWSKSHNHEFYNNPLTGVSVFERKPEYFASFTEMYSKRKFWSLPNPRELDEALEAFGDYVNKIKGRRPEHHH